MVLALASLSTLAAPARAGCELQKLGELPVTMHGLQPQTTAKVNGHDADFIADSGAFHSLLTTQASTDFGLKLRGAPVDLVVEGAAGRSNVSETTAKDFEFSGFTYHDVEFLVADQPFGPGVVGLLGQNVLRSADVEYDFGGGAIRFFAPKGCGGTPLVYWTETFSSISLDDTVRYEPLTSGTVYVDGLPLKAMFDTGSPRTMIDLTAAEKFGFRTDHPGVKDAGSIQGVGNGRHVRAWVAPIASFKIGDEEIKNTQVLVADLGGDFQEATGDMVVGADFFLAHRILVSVSQRRMYFSYSGGPVFRFDQSGASAAADGSSPATTAGAEANADPAALARRASASAARADYGAAIAELTQAMALDATNADYPLARAQAEIRTGRPQDAAKDIDLTLKLRPDDTQALMMRGGGYLASGEPDRARQDLGKVDKALPEGSDERLALAAIYGAHHLYDDEIAQLGRWIAANPKSAGLADAENDRCWARAEWDKDLDGALADCNAALRQSPGLPAYLDSRGLVRLRLGDLTGAIRDYDAALAKSPNQASSLYGRGVAELKAGDKAAGEADIAAAIALDPKRGDWAKTIGLAP